MAATATAALRDLIVIGEIPPGAPLRLEEVAHRLGMSISPVREAVRQLEGFGLAEHVPYKGAHVTMIDRSEMRDVYEARLALESLAARRAAVSYDRESDELLGDVLDELAIAYTEGDRARIVRGNTAFHLALAVASRSRWIRRLLRPTLDTSERFSAVVISETSAKNVHTIEEQGHRAIVTACRNHDPDAAERALRDHLESFVEIFEAELTPAPAG